MGDKIKRFAYLGPGKQGSNILGRLLGWMGPLGIDVETVSLKDRRLLGAAFAINPGEAFYFPVESQEFPWGILADDRIPKVFHNGGFDIRVLEDHRPGLRIRNYYDSCLAAQLLGLPARLGDLCMVLFGREPRRIEELIGSGKNAISMADVPEDKIATRACLDARDALEAWYAIGYKVPQKALDLELRFLPVALDMERRGIRIDRDAVRRHRERLERQLVYYRTIAEGMGFNPGSSQQLATMLEAQGYMVLYKRGKDGRKRPRLDKNMINLFYTGIPEAALVREYRSVQTLLTHLIKPLDEGRYLDGDRIYPRMNLNVVSTGRISRSNPATQNIRAELRDIIIPSEGNLIWDWDFSQIELRWAAYLWDDKEMLRMFRNGEDIHAGTAERMVREGVGNLLGSTPQARRRTAKDINFAVLYGGDEDTLWTRKKIPHDIGRRFLEAYFSVFKGLKAGIERTREFALKNGYTETYYGRRRDLSEKLESQSKYTREEALRALVNHPIQGSASETLKEALCKQGQEPLFHTAHDEGLIDAPPGYVLSGLDHVAPFETPVEVKIGTNWRDMVKV